MLVLHRPIEPTTQSGHWAYQHLRPKLTQAGAAESCQVVLSFGVVLEGHLLRDPVDRNIGLSATKLLQGGLGDIVLAGHASGGREHPMSADEIGALTDALTREPHRCLVVASDIRGVGGDAEVDR